ncbi:DUF2147 domain-containing protein [Pedobacter alpinus]|uniref:DUF2147 domain-containing protein n=1 Tax=Pedobacter alpinus TaxID=1590643 RepID=A0ABW5TVK0_9SPHI
MKKTIFFIAIVFASLGVFAQSADAVIGKWTNSEGEAHIQIYKKGNKYYGKLAWLKSPNTQAGKPKTDVNNSETSLRTRPILGLEFLKNFSYSDKTWEEGTIYDPKSGKTYSCKITMSGNDKLNVRGYVGISLIGRTDTWTRVK